MHMYFKYCELNYKSSSASPQYSTNSPFNLWSPGLDSTIVNTNFYTGWICTTYTYIASTVSMPHT